MQHNVRPSLGGLLGREFGLEVIFVCVCVLCVGLL